MGKLPLFSELARQAESATATKVGWPAPADPDLAIDEAEYDLSLLEKLVGVDIEQTYGTANYLLTANDHLARALRFRARRWLPKWNQADGRLDIRPPQEATWTLLGRTR